MSKETEICGSEGYLCRKETCATSYKGSDAFYIVQYMCRPSDVRRLEELIFLWAACVEVE